MPGRRLRRDLRRSRRPGFSPRGFNPRGFNPTRFNPSRFNPNGSSRTRFASPPAVRLARGGVGPFAVRSRAASP
ncbi:hypothetical protein D9T17_12235 [Lysobacter enzymogenes]|uniref:Uncharacterized protein n=1 Tax=Lysobacter enzymogenes TaxID=69 RepID=A0A3N2RH02_LYSEN|nr:hypothetical protein D9T17_12235 [Lysobacter enzymogenes]